MAMGGDTTGAKDGVLFAIKKDECHGGNSRDVAQWPVLEEVQMNGQKWKRWAQLYYVEGQKYSIGQRFESRAAQGEYLFCYGLGVSKTTHCEIICEDRSFWIVDLKGSKGGGTFVNGSRINVGTKTELRFGDIISLGGVTSVGGFENDKKCTAFWFKKSSGEECDQEVEDMLISEIGEAEKENIFPVRNSLIFSKILSYLPLSDIKNCRLVSSEWTEEATKALLKLSLARLNFSQGYAPSTARTRFFAFIQEMGQIVSQGRFHLKLPDCKCDHQFGKYDFYSCGMEIPQIGTPPHKFWFDLEWFFDGGFPHPVTMLKLNGSLRCEQGVTLCKTVLERVKHTLEDLDLILDFDVKLQGKPKPFCIPFPVLKTLDVTLQSTYIYIPREEFDEYGLIHEVDVNHDYSDKMSDWITSMIQSAPGVQTLKLKTLTAMALEFHNFVLKTIIGNEGFTNLNSLELRNYNQDSLKLLLKLPRTLQSLSLEHDKDYVKTWGQYRKERQRLAGDWLDSDSDSDHSDVEGVEGNCNSDDDVEKEGGEDIEVGYNDSDDDKDNYVGADFKITMEFKMLLENVLQKMACELKYLCIYIPNLMVLKQNTIQMPAFPNLKVLKLNGLRKNCITFSDFGLDYERHFPLLEHLDIHSLTNGRNFFEIFRPIEADYEFKTLRILDLKLENRKRRWSLTSLIRLSKLFPNVINPQLENVRELPPYDL